MPHAIVGACIDRPGSYPALVSEITILENCSLIFYYLSSCQCVLVPLLPSRIEKISTERSGNQAFIDIKVDDLSTLSKEFCRGLHCQNSIAIKILPPITGCKRP